MAINTINNGGGPLPVNGSGSRAGQKGLDNARGSEAGGSDRLELSSESQQLDGLRATLGDGAPVDTDRVESLRAAIADGSYKVDAERLAAKLFGFESAL